jgi:hypothetical protein
VVLAAAALFLLLTPPAATPTPAGPVYAVIPSPISGVPLPPEGTVEPDLTRIRTQQAAAERDQAFKLLDADRKLSKAEKAAIRRKLASLTTVIMTTMRPLEDVVAFYEKTVPRAEFIFAVRDLAADLAEGVRSGAIQASPERVREAAGRQGRSARWMREAERISIAVEDHLVDPRDGKITKKTVVLVTSFGD